MERFTGRVLTPGERLLLARRRARITQKELADWLGVSPRRLSRWEKDEEDGAPPVPISALSPGEQCFFRRKWAGLSVKEVAEELGLSPRWIQRAEAGESKNIEPLTGFWEARYYEF